MPRDSVAPMTDLTVSNFDLLVLGAGNAGQAAAGIAREAGWSVGIVEARDFGGTCPLRGCVPKKVLVAAAGVLDQISTASAHGITVGAPTLDWAKLIERKRGFVRGVPESMEASLAKQGIEVIHGRGRFTGRNAVDVDGRAITARKLVIATGSKPRELDFPGGALAITSDDILELPQLPTSVVFIGAGVIAFEFAHVFARAGTRVTMLELGAQPLASLEYDAVSQLVGASRALGIDLFTRVTVQRIERARGGFEVHYEHDGQMRTIETALVANGAGRIADLDSLGLENAGIEREGVGVKLDSYLRSVSNQDVFVAGDAITTKPQLSAVATYEGKIVGRNLTSESLQAPDYSWIPSAVFTIPVLASVGRTEARAREDGVSLAVSVNDMREWRSARTYSESVAYAKVLVDKDNGTIVGAHLVGHGAAETIHVFALAMRYGIPASGLRDMVYAYPTFSSDIKFML